MNSIDWGNSGTIFCKGEMIMLLPVELENVYGSDTRNRKARIFSFLIAFLISFSLCFGVQSSQSSQSSQSAQRALIKKKLIILLSVTNLLLHKEKNPVKAKLLEGALESYADQDVHNMYLKLNHYLEGSIKTNKYNLEQYLTLTEGQTRILIVGGGLTFEHAYSHNCFLLNINNDHDPDWVADFSIKNSAVLEPLLHKFDIVILEHVPIPYIVQDGFLSNVKAVLKPEGKLILNPLYGFEERVGIVTKAAKHVLLEGVYHADIMIGTGMNYNVGIPFTIYLNENIYKIYEKSLSLHEPSKQLISAIEHKFFADIIKPFFEQRGFKNMQIIPNKDFAHITGLEERYLFQAEISS